VIYKQFSITIVSAMALSVLVALIFTPALCATMLKPIDPEKHGQPKRGFFGWFNRTFDRSVVSYENGVKRMVTHKLPAFLVYLIIFAGMIWLFMHSGRVPAGRRPGRDLRSSPDSGRFFCRAYAESHRRNAHLPARRRQRRGCRGEIGVQRQRLQLRRSWPEFGPGVRDAQAVG
jgi:hypothetical protein